MPKNSKSYIIFFLFVSALIFFGFLINQIKNQVLSNLTFQNTVTKARLLDQDISKIFLNKHDFYNYDSMNTKFNRLEESIDELKEKLKKDILINKENISKKLINIEEKVKKKRSLLEKFKAYNSILNNSYRYISVLNEEVMEKQTIEDKKRQILLSKLFANVMALKLNEIERKEQRALIQRIESQGGNSSEIINDFINHSKIIMKFDGKLKKLLERTQKLNIDTHFQEFSDVTDKYFRTIIYIGTAITIFMISLVIIFAALIWRFNVKQIQDKRDLKKFKRSVEESDNIVLITDKKNRVTYVNDTFEKITGYSKDEIIGEDPRILSSGKHDKHFYDDLRSSLNRGKKWSGEFVNRKKDGSLFYEKTTITPILDSNGEAESFIAIKLDVTKDKEYQKKIEEKNIEITNRYYTDSLTDLKNRNCLLDDLAEHNIGVLILVNIDNFNEFKFFYGIEASDELIVQTGKLLKTLSYGIGDSILYKLDGDEFCFWSEDLSLLNEIDNVMKNLYEEIATHSFFINKQEVHITATLGVSYYYFTEQTNVNDLIIHGDLAHRYAKQNKLPYAVFKPEDKMEDFYRDNLIWTQKITEALDESRIITYYQPIVDCNEKIISYETLVRLVERDGTVVSPFKFLDTAKKSNQYTKITKRVIQQAFKTFDKQDIRFSINIDFEDIDSQEVRDLLREKLQTSNKPENFTAEILESDSISNYEKVEDFIKELKEFGCKIAIDDFGSGYSNFERVVKLDVDYIKIDGSILKNIDKDENMKKIAESIVHFAKKINKEIVGEFVSTEEIFNESKKLDIDYFQGYYFREPKESL